MKSVLRKILASFLLVLFVSTTFGITVSKMTCVNSGRVQYEIGKLEDCCPPCGTQQDAVKPLCCKFSQYDFSADLPYQSPKAEADNVVETGFAGYLSRAIVFNVDHDVRYHYTDSSPPEQERERYLLFESFLI